MSDRRPKSIYPDAITFTLQDASALSGLSTDSLRRREKEGALRFVRVGCRTLVDGDTLRRLLGAGMKAAA